MSQNQIGAMKRKMKKRKDATASNLSDANGKPYISEEEYTELPVQLFELDDCGADALKITLKLLATREKHLSVVRG